MANKAEVEAFAKAWVTTHVRVVPGANLANEVDRLAAHITGDARMEGISGRELHSALGDIDDYLTGQYQQVADATAARSSV
jgi:hypothetical protein